MSENRIKNVEQLKEISECDVILIKKNDVNKYILNDHPLHSAYEYLSETHKADYLRTYFMNFYGGGYSDIKKTTGSWKKSFDNLEKSDKWICGYAEIEGGVGYPPLVNEWKSLIGNGAYICKPQTQLTKEWYNGMIKLLDSKLDELKNHPATNPQDKYESGSGYPIKWTEMLGDIFHPVCFKYKDKLMNTLPKCIFTNYR